MSKMFSHFVPSMIPPLIDCIAACRGAPRAHLSSWNRKPKRGKYGRTVLGRYIRRLRRMPVWP